MAMEKVRENSNQSPMATFRCTICGDTFHDIDVLEKHIHQQHKFKQSSEDFCDLCKTYVNDNLKKHDCTKQNESVANNLQTVVKSSSSENKETIEKNCATKPVAKKVREIGFAEGSDGLKRDNFKDQSQLHSSIESIDQNETVAKHCCSVCSKEFVHKKYLEIHIKVEHEGNEEFRCDLCPKTFVAEEYLRRHKSRLHSNSKTKNECDICKRTFCGSRTLTKHKKQVHYGIKEHACQICKKAFADPKNLRVHIKVVHHKVRDYVCDICKKSFSVPCNLKVHVQNVHKEIRDVHCDKCDSSFKSDFALRSHMKFKHSKALSYKCNLCEESFSSKSWLSSHIERTHVKSRSGCPFCQKSFTDASWLKYHIKSAHQNYISCKICKKLFPDKKLLETHQKSHKDEDTKCSICEKKFVSMRNKRVHIKRLHRNYVKCNGCRRLFADNEKLLIHRKINEKDLSCNICEKKFCSVIVQRSHIKLKHENHVNCKQCNKIFSDNEKLLIHQETHNCVKCKQCTKIFSDNEKLLVHQETHKEDKCAFCSKSFQSSSVLARRKHINLSHRNFIPCGKCSNIYSNLEKLTIHQQSHVKELPCKFCPKIFKSTEGLKKHLKLDHENYARCYKCAKMFSDKEEYEIHRMQCENKKECSVCFKSFGTQGGRDRHMKSVHKMDKSPKSC